MSDSTMNIEEELRRQSLKEEHRRQSLKTEQNIRHQPIIMSQPRASIASDMSQDKPTALNPFGTSLGGGAGFGDIAMMTLRAKRVSNRMRRKSVNPKIDPPPGLEGINDKSFVYIRQQMDMDLKGGCGSANTYKIWDENEEELFYVLEDATCCCRWFCGPNRQFRLDFFTPQDDLVFSLHRKCCRCDWCCCLDCFMCNHKVYVVDCLSRTLGSIRQRFSIFRSKFDIIDSQGNTVAMIKGPICPCRCCTEITFEIYDKNNENIIGYITKKWEGEREDGINVDHEYFDIHFPEKMDPIEKMLIIGGAYLVGASLSGGLFVSPGVYQASKRQLRLSGFI